ncbi:helix-turn-helix domain-containing protein [Thalassobius sp. S69A]|uniref:helix-turn-helix domain-containing protein n=1 Tax=unclassified Thalassovita TaxID=2619711 RepID=UPI003C7CF460
MTDLPLPQNLTPTQLRIFALLRRGGIRSTDHIVDHIYGDREDGGPLGAKRVIYTQIRALRRKLEGTGYTLRTIGWQGYKMEIHHD